MGAPFGDWALPPLDQISERQARREQIILSDAGMRPAMCPKGESSRYPNRRWDISGFDEPRLGRKASGEAVRNSACCDETGAFLARVARV